MINIGVETFFREISRKFLDVYSHNKPMGRFMDHYEGVEIGSILSEVFSTFKCFLSLSFRI